MSTALTVHEGQFEEEIKPHRIALAEYLTPEFRDYALTSNEDFAEMADIINDIKKRAKQLEELEKSATRPILAGAEVVRSWFRSDRKAAEEARAVCDVKVKVYLAKQAQEQAEIQRKLELAAKSGDKKTVKTELAKLENAPIAAGLSVVNTVDYEVLNLGLVPEQFTVLSLDKEALETEITRQKSLLKGQELPVIPGIKFSWKQTVRAIGK